MKAEAEKLYFDLQDIEVSITRKQYKTEKIKCIIQAFNEIAEKQRQRDVIESKQK